MRATEHAPRGTFRLLERFYGLAEIVERGAVVRVERLRVITPQPQRGIMTFPENTPSTGVALRSNDLASSKRFISFSVDA